MSAHVDSLGVTGTLPNHPEKVQIMTHDSNLHEWSARLTLQDLPIPFPHTPVHPERMEVLGCFRCVVWCVVFEVALGLAAAMGWYLWSSHGS
jgi:hypothetical protein